MATKWVYMFTEGNATMRNLLGGKGANLAEMTNLGLPVPQGFTITTEACTQYYEDGRKINDEIMAQIMESITKMEEITGKKFGDKENPLLVSVRSGARASMPGMMDTILNLGLNEEVVEVLAAHSGNPRWAWDCYRRFIQMYSDVVMEVGKKYFEELIDKMKADRGVKQDVELTAEDLKELANQFKAEYKEKIGAEFPTDPKEQEKEVQQSDSSQSSISPFYGIWCGAAKTEAEAQKQAKKIRENGFDAQVFVTTDWSNLNTEKWYVITAGIYGTKEAASAVLQDVQRVCSDAYIKYTGNWQG